MHSMRRPSRKFWNLHGNQSKTQDLTELFCQIFLAEILDKMHVQRSMSQSTACFSVFWITGAIVVKQYDKIHSNRFLLT